MGCPNGLRRLAALSPHDGFLQSECMLLTTPASSMPGLMGGGGLGEDARTGNQRSDVFLRPLSSGPRPPTRQAIQCTPSTHHSHSIAQPPHPACHPPSHPRLHLHIHQVTQLVE